MKQPELGYKVLELRQSRGLTQSELAESCNLSLRTIQRIESLEATPRNYTIKAIFECLGYDLKDLSSDTPNIKAEEVDRDNRIKRSLKYAQELFNLKTNTMKKLRVLSLFAVLLFAGIFVTNTTINAQQNRKLKFVTESLVGVWQRVDTNPETGDVAHYLPVLKIFNSDGTYLHMSEVAGKNFSFINASGKWKLIAENVFHEYVELMHDAAFTDRKEQQTFRIEKRADGVFMNSKYKIIGADMGEIHETWRKCGLVSREKAEKIWSGK